MKSSQRLCHITDNVLFFHVAPPKVQLPSRREPVVAENGGEIVIKAPYSAHPPPKVKWMKNGNEIQQGKEESTINQ